jgi:hypothetical protein
MLCRPWRPVDLRGSLSVVSPRAKIGSSGSSWLKLPRPGNIGVNAGCNVLQNGMLGHLRCQDDRVKGLLIGGRSDAKLHNLHESRKASPLKGTKHHAAHWQRLGT